MSSQDLSELRAEVIEAVCFKPSIVGHLEQFVAIEALIDRKCKEARVKELKHLITKKEAVTYKSDNGHGFAVSYGDLAARLEALESGTADTKEEAE